MIVSADAITKMKKKDMSAAEKKNAEIQTYDQCEDDRQDRKLAPKKKDVDIPDA